MANVVGIVRVYRFGAFALDARTGELTNAGRRTPLREQPLQLLLALLERPGDLISREELTSRLWPAGTFVDFDRGLNKAINHLREALGDSADQPRFIETLPRKGYRFIAPVTSEPQLPEQATGDGPLRSATRWARTVTIVAIVVAAVGAGIGGARYWFGAGRVLPRISSLAVLPLENLSHDPDQEYFADGITDALITDLARMGSLRVTSRTSVMRFKRTRKSVGEIGRELDVDAVVEGTVVRSGTRVRISAQLIQVSTDMHLWAESYERELSEMLDLQRVVAADIARRVNVVVKPLEGARTVDPEAYGLYLKGRYSFYQYTNEGWQRAIDYFSQAVERDPKFALAHSGLADTYLVAGAYGAIPEEEALARAKTAAAEALALDDTLARAHYVQATALAWYDWQWAAAEHEFRRARELDPNDALGRNWYAAFLSVRGRHEEAIAEQERARELDPLSLIVNANLTRALYWARRYDEAIAQARRTLEMDRRFGVALFWLEGALRHQGRFKEAVALRQSVGSPEQAAAIERTFSTGGFPAILRLSAKTLEKSGSPVAAARCYAQLGEKEKALSLLEACAARRCSSLVHLPVEPDFDVLRSEPRFRSLLRLVDPESD